MYITKIANRKSPPTVLLRESYRENGKVKTRTLANLSNLPPEAIEVLRRHLKGEKLISADQAIEAMADGSRAHGHVAAVMNAMRRLDFPSLISSERSRRRDLVIAMVVAGILQPKPRLNTTLWWQTTTLPDLLKIHDAKEDELYDAMDWLRRRQRRIEKKLARRYIGIRKTAWCNLTSSYFKNSNFRSDTRDDFRNLERDAITLDYGLITDCSGIPVAISVFEDDATDPAKLLSQIMGIPYHLCAQQFILVDDQSLLSEQQIDRLKCVEGVEWIAGFPAESVKRFFRNEANHTDLPNAGPLLDIQYSDFPGERFIVEHNPALGTEQAEYRKKLLAAAAKEFEQIRQRGSPRLTIVNAEEHTGRQIIDWQQLSNDKDAIETMLVRVANKYNVGKYFRIRIRDDDFDFKINQKIIDAESALDGVRILRTSLSREQMDAKLILRTAIRSRMAKRAFCRCEAADFMDRSIRLPMEDHIRAHLFLFMLVYYVQWHMMDAWHPLIHPGKMMHTEHVHHATRPLAQRTSTIEKNATIHVDENSMVHHFESLLHRLSAITRTNCRYPSTGAESATFTIVNKTNPLQEEAFALIEAIGFKKG